MTCEPGSPGTPRPPWSPGWRPCVPRPGDVPGHATRVALRELGRRAQFLDGQLERLDELIVPLVTTHAPGLLAVYGLGPRTAALLLIAAGDHPGRLRSEAAWAHLCGVAPIPASSDKHKSIDQVTHVAELLARSVTAHWRAGTGIRYAAWAGAVAVASTRRMAISMPDEMPFPG